MFTFCFGTNLLNIYIFISDLVLSDKQVIFKVLFKRNTKHLARTWHAFLSALADSYFMKPRREEK